MDILEKVLQNDDKMMTGSSDECWLVRQTLALIDIQFLQLDCSTALSSNLGRAPLANQIDGGGKFQ